MQIISEKLATSLNNMLSEAKSILVNSIATRDKVRARTTSGMRKRYNNYEYNRLQKLKKKVNEFSGNEKEFTKIYNRVKKYRPRSLSIRRNLAGIGAGTIMGSIIKSNQPETKGF